MKIVKIATAAAMAISLVGAPINVLADQNQDTRVTTTSVKNSIKQANNASVSKFYLYGNDLLNTYNEVFKMDKSNIVSITNNGGNYPGSPLEKAIDGDMNTHWETGKQNNATFTNEVIFNFNETTSLDRIVYAARQASAKGKGFAQEFEIYSSTTDEGDDFTLVSSGEYKGSTGDIVEIQFKPTEFKRLKFVYKKANQDWASASEFLFYKEDRVSDKMEKLFTDDTFSTISKEFNTPDALNQLEEEVKDHPLYPLFKEDIENAKSLLNQKVIEATTAAVSKLKSYGTNFDNAYSEAFRMPNSNVSKVTTNGGSYPTTKPEFMLDDQPNTHWETNKNNDANFTNEVVFELENAEVLDRVAFLARSVNQKGFPEEFEIYASETSKGETFQLVSSGEAVRTSDFLEFKFEPTKFKRLKFKFKKAYTDRPFAAEFRFYKEDSISNKMDNLFTNEHQNKVSEPFNTLEKLEAFEQSAQSHPLYELYKEDFENAKVLLNEGKVETTPAATKPFEHYSNEDYSKLFKVDNENIKSIRNNAGNWGSAVIGNAIDGDLDTYWETNKGNSTDFSNEVEVEFKEAVELNRIMYGARKSDRKGFAEDFEIYMSQTSKGDTYQLVSTGGHNVVAGLVEAKFEPTTFKRVKFKFKKSTQNWASLAELAFYTEDAVADKVNNIFTDGTMSAVVPEFNSVDKINALENEAKAHPLYDIFKERLDLAKKIVQGEINGEGTTVVAEQRGDMVKHAKENLKFGFGNNLQPTGFAAQPGDKITVYVDANTNGPLPKLSFAQQDGSFANWRRDVALVPGKNEITVPQVNKDSWYKHDVTPGGSIYIINPYTEEQQGKAPKIRFEGVEKIPFATKDTNIAEFKSFLKEYKKKMDEDIVKHPNVEDREVLDVFEFVSDHIVWTGTATGAYQTYIVDGYSPLETIESYNTHMEEIFRYYGLNASDESNDPKLIRDNVRLAQPFGYMYAYTDHIGVQGDVMANHLIPFEVRGQSWGLTHEIGHRMDVNARLYGEITNNMLPQHMSAYYGQIDTRIPYEGYIYNNVIDENLKDYNEQGLFERLGVFWQLEMYSPGYWGKLNRLYRERDVQLTDGEISKQQYLVQFSSEVLKLDLSEYFARHGFTVSKETRALTSKYKKPNEKLWYLNNSVVGYKGNGIKDKKVSVGVSVDPNAEKNTNTLNFTMDKSYAEDFLGYEIIRNGKVIGFTSTNSFIDKEVDTSENYKYQIVVYDKKLKALEPVEFNSLKPTIAVEDHLTLKLHQEFDPMNYVKALNFEGNDITNDVTIKSNTVDVTKKGNYEIVYEITNADSVETKTTKVTVTSDFAYISDLTAKSATVGWGSLQKDKSVSGKTITLIRQGLDAIYEKGIGVHANSEVVYDIEGKDFNFFESYIGIDQAMKGRPSSATFEVWVDGEKKFASDVFKADTEHEFVKVPVAGAKEVKLVTTDANNNGNTADHTVWADAKFTQDSSKPTLTIPKSTATKVGTPIDINEQYTAFDAEDGDLTATVQVTGADQVNFDRAGKYELTYTVTDSDGNEATAKRTISVVNMDDYNYLSDFDWTSTQNSYAAPKKDISMSAKTLRLTAEDGSEVAYEKGIGAHSNSTIVYDLTDKDADFFTSFVGVDRQMYGSVGSVTFQVFVDGEKQFDSGLMNSRDPQKFVEVNISGAKELKVVVTDGGNGIGSDHATWGDAKLHFANPDSIFTKDLEAAISEAKAINAEDYTSESVASLQTSIAKAEETLANKQATQADIDQAVAMLKQAKESLVAIDLGQFITIPDTSLSTFIKQTLGITGEITLGDMHKLTSLSAVGTRTERVASLEGLQFAKNLVTLDISGNEVTDFSPLQGLKKLENLIADPQVIEMPSPTGQSSIFNVENPVIGLDGKHVNPTQIGLRYNKTFKEIAVDVDQLEANANQFTIDLTEEEQGVYTLVMVYEVEGNMIQIMSMIDNK
ncbi:NPCBM/NEW2 domain-containing protein [Lysinibacillus sp. NPDC097287]|uniref:NPCBM/NEW2 domain-containing protein n=1 Tax=Lysinibacillus sp. NPDC097287 TaxID=3364144 RepID=UPI0037F1B01C